MIPILFPDTAEQFSTQGLGALSDAISCTVHEVLNGEYELEMEYPMDGIHYSEMTARCIIYAIPSPYRSPQPFRIYRQSRPLDGIVTFYARHISYDLSGVPVTPFSSSGVVDALASIEQSWVVPCSFHFWTDKTTSANFSISVPSATRSILGGTEGSILDVYGGEYEWDGFTVRLWNHRGQDNGVTVSYGKNLTDISQDYNDSGVLTGIMPYWLGQDGTLVQSNPAIIEAPGTYDFENIQPVDFSQEFEEQPTVEQLTERGQQYVNANDVGKPTVSTTVSFVQLEQMEQYKDLALLEKCDIGDSVTVRFSRLGVDSKARIVEIETDVLMERYNSVTLGNVQASMSSIVSDQQQEIQQKPSTSFVENAVSNATNWLTNGKGYMVARKDAAGNTIDLLFMDTPDINTATDVLRIGQSGMGFSHTGVNGPYTNAWTIDGNLLADFITGGTLNAEEVNIINLIVNHLRSTGGWFTLDSQNGMLEMFHDTALRMRLFGYYYSGTTPDIENTFGNVQVYYGNFDSDGNFLDSNARYGYFTARDMAIGEDSDGNYIFRVFSNGTVRVPGSFEIGQIYGNSTWIVPTNPGMWEFRMAGSGGYIALQMFVEQSGDQRCIFRPASDGQAYIGSASYRWNTVFCYTMNETSDRKLKEDIASIDKAKDFILSLNPVSYKRKGGKRIHMGFIAQEVAQAAKENQMGDLSLYQASVVHEDGTETYYDAETPDENLSWGLTYSELIAPLVALVQEQEKRIAALEEKLKEG
nr:MAG TPA: tail protein [Caudoviricetes sp.]